MATVSSSLKQDAKYLKFEQELLGSDYTIIMKEELSNQIGGSTTSLMSNETSDGDDSSVYVANLLPDTNDFDDPSTQECSARTSPSGGAFDITIDEVEDRFGMDAELQEDVQETVENLRRLRAASIHDKPFSSIGAEMPQRYRYESIEIFFPASPHPMGGPRKSPRARAPLKDIELPKAPSPKAIKVHPSDDEPLQVGSDLQDMDSTEVVNRGRANDGLPNEIHSAPSIHELSSHKRVPSSPPPTELIIDAVPFPAKRLPKYVPSEKFQDGSSEAPEVAISRPKRRSASSSPPPPRTTELSRPPDRLIEPIHTRNATKSYTQIEEMFEVHSNHFMSVTHVDSPWDVEALKIQRSHHDYNLVKVADFGPSNTAINPVLLHSLEQVTFENQYLLTLCRILENEHTNISRQDPNALAEDCIYLAQLITNLETTLSCEKELQLFNRTTRQKHRELNLALSHQKRSLAPGIRLFQAQTSIEIRYGDQSCLCSCLHFTELRELICMTWGEDISTKPIFGWVGGGLMTISNPDAFSYFLQSPDRLPSLLIVDSDVLSPDQMKELLKSKANYEKTDRLIQRGLHWEAMNAKNLLYLTWPFNVQTPNRSHNYCYRFRTTKHNNVHKNTLRFLDLDTARRHITMTHPDRPNYKIVIDEMTIQNMRPGGKPCEIHLNCAIQHSIAAELPNLSFESSSNLAVTPSSAPLSVPSFSPEPSTTSSGGRSLPSTFSSFVSKSASSPRTVNKQYDLIFESPEEKNRFLRLTQFFILQLDHETQLYVKPMLMKQIFLMPNQAQLKAEIINRAPLELIGAMCHQVWLEYMLQDGWSQSDIGGTDAFLLAHENIVPWEDLSALVRKDQLLIFERFFSYFVTLGIRLEDRRHIDLPDRAEKARASFEQNWLSKLPADSWGYDSDALFPFVWVLAEHLHDLHSFMKIRNGYQLGDDSSSASRTNWLRPFSEVATVSPGYRDMRGNQVVIIFKILRLIGFKVSLDQPYKPVSDEDEDAPPLVHE